VLDSTRLPALLLLGICIVLGAASPTPTKPADVQASRIRIQYFVPKDPAMEPIYRMLKEHRALETMQEIFSPFRLPIELTLRTGSCEGVANAWYDRPEVSVCYEYVNEILQMSRNEASATGVPVSDAVIGQFFYVVAHEMGHAMFDILMVPIVGNEEIAADQFAAYIMLQFGKNQSRALITGAALAYNMYVQNPQVRAPLAAFSDVHAAPAQRFFNLLCLAYGGDPVLFADFVAKGYLPKDRARNCKREYDQVAFAFRELIVPHLDRQLERQVMDRAWLPEVKARWSPN
jgi:Putative metallopeptidase